MEGIGLGAQGGAHSPRIAAPPVPRSGGWQAQVRAIDDFTATGVNDCAAAAERCRWALARAGDARSEGQRAERRPAGARSEAGARKARRVQAKAERAPIPARLAG